MKSLSLSVARIVRLLIILSLLGAISAPIAQGQVTFAMPPTFVGFLPGFVADFNGDGKPDILSYDGTLNVGNGDGTFHTGVQLNTVVLAVADFNGDGKPDVFVGNAIFFGNGDGTFQPPVTVTGIVPSIVWAIDLNGDGKADLLGLSSDGKQLVVYIGNGDGTFKAGVPYNLGTVYVTAWLVFGDFNGDHKTDVAVICGCLQPQGVVLLGNGDGTFQSTPLPLAVPAFASWTVAGDFNGDGKLDLATFNLVGSGNAYVSTVSLQLGNGDGTFQTATTACTIPGSSATGGNIAAADVNGDGKLDLVIGATVIGVCLGNGDGTFSNAPNYYQPVSSAGAFVVIADFNLDGKPDVVANNEILLGKGNGTFQGQAATPLPYSSFNASVVGKFVKNGAPGVAVVGLSSSNGSVSTLSILTNNGTGALSLAHTYVLPQPGSGIATADLNGDGNLDLIVTGSAPTSMNWSYSVLLGNGDGSFKPPVLYQQSVPGGGTLPIVMADFNGDGKVDMAVPIGTSVAVLLGNGDGTFGSPAYFLDGNASSIVSADFNGDAKLDIAAAGGSGLAILLGKGDGTFQPATFPGIALGYPLLTADLNGDGKADLVGPVVLHSGPYPSGAIQVLLGNGDGTFSSLGTFPGSGIYSYSTAIALADMNGDGKLDVISLDEYLPTDNIGATSANGIYLGKGDGTFNPSEIPIPETYLYPLFVVSPEPFGVLAADMNGDGKPDIVVEGLSTVFVLLNSTVQVPGFTISAAAPSPGSVTAGGSATTTVTIASVGGFNQSVTLSCASIMLNGAPATTAPPSCKFSPASVTNASGTSTLTISTTATSAWLVPVSTRPRGLFYAMLLPVLGIVLTGTGFRSRARRLLGILPFCLTISVLLFLAACGGGNSGGGGGGGGGTPAGTYTISISGSAGSMVNTTKVTLTVQ
jgi:hypothetical protein